MPRMFGWEIRFSAEPLSQARWRWTPSRNIVIREGARVHWPAAKLEMWMQEERSYRWLCFNLLAFGPRKYV